MNPYLHNANRIMSRINELAAITEEPGCVTRRYNTPAFLEGSKLVRQWMEEAGLETRVDQIGNVRGRLTSADPKAKTFVIASHIDTVVNAGKFDGPLGVILGIELLEKLAGRKEALPFHIELIAFSDEEGVRFHTTFLGSRVVTGAFDPALLSKTDADGITLLQAIETGGGNSALLAGDAIPADNWLGYFEVHIEQGPVLYEKEVPVGLVTAIAGQKRIQVSFTGFAGHAGTVPMDMRQDALCAAAVFILGIERFALENKDHIVATVGKMEVHHAASNVIPGKVTFSIDLRSADAKALEKAYTTIHEIGETICKVRKIGFDWTLVQETAPVICDEQLNQHLSDAVTAAGYPLLKLVSGAGHDAVPVSVVAPVTMLFVKCYKGISHNPLENAEAADIAAAMMVAEQFIGNLSAALFK